MFTLSPPPSICYQMLNFDLELNKQVLLFSKFISEFSNYYL